MPRQRTSDQHPLAASGKRNTRRPSNNWRWPSPLLKYWPLLTPPSPLSWKLMPAKEDLEPSWARSNQTGPSGWWLMQASAFVPQTAMRPTTAVLSWRCWCWSGQWQESSEATCLVPSLRCWLTITHWHISRPQIWEHWNSGGQPSWDSLTSLSGTSLAGPTELTPSPGCQMVSSFPHLLPPYLPRLLQYRKSGVGPWGTTDCLPNLNTSYANWEAEDFNQDAADVIPGRGKTTTGGFRNCSCPEGVVRPTQRFCDWCSVNPLLTAPMSEDAEWCALPTGPRQHPWRPSS